MRRQPPPQIALRVDFQNKTHCVSCKKMIKIGGWQKWMKLNPQKKKCSPTQTCPMTYTCWKVTIQPPKMWHTHQIKLKCGGIFFLFHGNRGQMSPHPLCLLTYHSCKSYLLHFESLFNRLGLTETNQALCNKLFKKYINLYFYLYQLLKWIIFRTNFRKLHLFLLLNKTHY